MPEQMSKPDTNLGQTIKGPSTLYKANPDYSATKEQYGPGDSPQVGYNRKQGLDDNETAIG